jgi:SAM-dependent methyltransferase
MSDYQSHCANQLSQWWQTPLGHELQQLERQRIHDAPLFFFGQHQLQLGGHAKVLPDTHMAMQQVVMHQGADVDAMPEALPLRAKSVDNLLIQHVLEFSCDPHQVLREAERVLVDDGSLVICSFNPISLWGLRRLISWHKSPPWHGHFFTRTRLKDWLALLNFDVVEIKTTAFCPPLQSAAWLSRFSFLERWGKRFWPIFGGVTIMVAVKRTIPVNPIRARWQSKAFFPATGFVNKPVTRDKTNG